MDPKQHIGGLSPRLTLAVSIGAALLAARAGTARADVAVPGLPAMTVGAGVQGNFYECSQACIYSPGTAASAGGSVEGFSLDSIRLYVNGSVTDQIKLTFDTEYSGSPPGGDNKVQVLDAIGRFEFSPEFNLWAGRFLPPTDRANLYGPYYANDWTPYADGVADYYPSVATGRDNGLAYWGDFGPLKVQGGAFDGASLGGLNPLIDQHKLLWASRVMFDFWDKEAGYYLNGTYYGDKDILALGAVAQTLDSKTTFNIDALMDKKLGAAGVLSIEAEYVHDNGLNALYSSNGWYGLASYLFPQQVGIGKFQILGKYSHKDVDSASPVVDEFAGNPSYSIRTTEFNVNYIIKEFNARVGVYYLLQKNDLPSAEASPESSPKEFGLKMQLQM